MFCNERVSGVAVGGVVVADGVMIGCDAVAVGCSCWTGGVVGSGVGSEVRVQAPMAAIARATVRTSATCRRDMIFDDGLCIISPCSRFVTAAAYAVTASRAIAPRVGGRRAGCAAQRDDSVAIDDDLRGLPRYAKVCLHVAVERCHLPRVSLFSGIVIYRRGGFRWVHIDGDEGDIILEVGVHILDGPQLGPA